MAHSFISVTEMIEYMSSGQPFSICYVTYDKASGRGGAVKHIDMATKCWIKNEDAPEATSRSSGNNPRGIVRNPNHFNNSTINIRVSAAGQADIRKVHIQLIRQFNGAIVK